MTDYQLLLIFYMSRKGMIHLTKQVEIHFYKLATLVGWARVTHTSTKPVPLPNLFLYQTHHQIIKSKTSSFVGI